MQIGNNILFIVQLFTLYEVIHNIAILIYYQGFPIFMQDQFVIFKKQNYRLRLYQYYFSKIYKNTYKLFFLLQEIFILRILLQLLFSKYMNKININIAEEADADTIKTFQVNMAKQTQNLDLVDNVVFQAVQYIIKEKTHGFYLVNRTPQNQINACLIITYQNQTSWWIGSVYVDQKYRKQGIFKDLFNKLVKISQEKGVKKLSLYAETNNMNALNIYQKFGMRIIPQILYGYDYFYTNYKPIQPLENILFKNVDTEITQFQDVLKQSRNQNTRIVIQNTDNKKIQLYAEYFEQFTDWRFGRIIYISSLFIKFGANKKRLIESLVHYLKNKLQGLQVRVIRFIASPEVQNLQKTLEDIEKLHYYILTIDI